MKEKENFLWGLFAGVGIILVVVGLIVAKSIFNYENKIDTVGTISEIYSNYNNIEDRREYEVYVSYTVDGKEYESRLDSYSSDFYEGKKINIYYDKDNPSKIGVKSLDLLFLMVPGIGLVFAIIGITGIITKANKNKSEKGLKEHGTLIYANYVETVLNTSLVLNGRSPYNIICEWTDPSDNMKYIFKSKNIWLNPEIMIREKDIKQFPVYIDPNNKKKYAVDVDSLTKNIIDLR